MKGVLVIYEGAADAACDELEGATPLELARGVHASSLAARGVSGLLIWPEDDPPARAEYFLAMVMGVTEQEARSLRRGPVEAAGAGEDGTAWTYAYRGNFLPVDEGVIRESRVSGLSFDETVWLTDVVREVAPPGSGLRVLGPGRICVTFDRLDRSVDPGEFPREGLRIRTPGEEEPDRDESDRAVFMRHCADVLARQSINEVRVDLGENPANMVWLWAGGPPVEPGRPFMGAPLKAAMVSNSPLARGMASLLGMAHLDLGDVWEDAAQPELISADALGRCIEQHELTVVYVEAPAEGGMFGTPVEKVKAIDRMDIHVLGRVIQALEGVRDHRLMVAALPEEGVFLATTPVVMAGRGVTADRVDRWHESAAASGGLGEQVAERCLTGLIGD